VAGRSLAGDFKNHSTIEEPYECSGHFDGTKVISKTPFVKDFLKIAKILLRNGFKTWHFVTNKVFISRAGLFNLSKII
jgi:hypothetical protein